MPTNNRQSDIRINKRIQEIMRDVTKAIEPKKGRLKVTADEDEECIAAAAVLAGLVDAMEKTMADDMLQHVDLLAKSIASQLVPQEFSKIVSADGRPMVLPS